MSLQSTTIPCPAPPLVLPRHQSSHQTPSRAATHPFDMFDAMSDPYDTPKPMPEAIRVLPAMPADAPAMVEVMDSAFVPTFHYQRMYPSGIVPEEDKRKRIELMQEAIESNEHMKLFKAVSGDYDNADFSDDEGAAAAMSEIDKEKRNESVNGNDKDIMNTKSELGRIVGWAQWKMYYKERPVEEWNKVIEKRKDENIKGMNVEHANWFFGTMEENRKRLFGGMPFASEYMLNPPGHGFLQRLLLKLTRLRNILVIRERSFIYFCLPLIFKLTFLLLALLPIFFMFSSQPSFTS